MPANKEQLVQQVAEAVAAGEPVALETVDFNDPLRPRTCLEVDFPILPVNQIAVIEGNAGKPIYQMSKWWARRRSSVFRSMLIAAAAKAPDDPSQAANLVWRSYYANHQLRGAFGKLKVADIFMGGGTTLVEGTRLGMRMTGNDLNPVAWFVVKQELADVDLDEVKRLLADIEAEVKPQVAPYFYCDGPNGEQGTWTHLPSGRVMPAAFDPLSLTIEERRAYRYDGPEAIYTFWAKHGPCRTPGCGHRTPIMASPVVAVKTLCVRHWERCCPACGGKFHVEQKPVRMAPGVPFCVAPSEPAFSILDELGGVECPHCGLKTLTGLGRGRRKKITLSLLVHPQWLEGCASGDAHGQSFGGSAQDDVASSMRWNDERTSRIRLLEVRGALPTEVTCPQTGITFQTGSGTVPKKSHFACSACAAVQDVLASVKATGKTGPMAGYAVQGYDPTRAAEGLPYGGRFFAPFGSLQARQYNAAMREWEARKDADLAGYWPRSALPYGFMTHYLQGGVPNHGFTHWWTMFNPRQLLVHSQLLKAIATLGDYDWAVREYVLGAFQQYLRNQSLFTLWNVQGDKLEPQFANNNYHPKSTVVENCVFLPLGRGNWAACAAGILQGREWALRPWEAVSVETLACTAPALARKLVNRSERVYPGDPVRGADLFQGSSTALAQIASASMDLVVTDPPFGNLLHYSELSDFFYVWLRLALKERYPEQFGPEYTPRSLEAVANRAREPADPDGFYQRVLTGCWREAHRILKPGGILAFTFHHGDDEPWIAMLESLLDAGFYLAATYPIRSDETKGQGEFGSRTIEYDVILVCRKRTNDPGPASWTRMRRELMAEALRLQAMLEEQSGHKLPPADQRVIRRGKALEYYSRHFGQVFLDSGELISLPQILVDVNGPGEPRRSRRQRSRTEDNPD